MVSRTHEIVRKIKWHSGVRDSKSHVRDNNWRVRDSKSRSRDRKKPIHVTPRAQYLPVLQVSRRLCTGGSCNSRQAHYAAHWHWHFLHGTWTGPGAQRPLWPYNVFFFFFTGHHGQTVGQRRPLLNSHPGSMPTVDCVVCRVQFLEDAPWRVGSIINAPSTNWTIPKPIARAAQISYVQCHFSFLQKVIENVTWYLSRRNAAGALTNTMYAQASWFDHACSEYHWDLKEHNWALRLSG